MHRARFYAYRAWKDGLALLEPQNRTMLMWVLLGTVFWVGVAYLAWDFATFWYFAGEDHFILPPWIDQRKHYYSQHHLGHTARSSILKLVHGSQNSYTAAHKYYEAQRPLFEAAAKEFELHPAFQFERDVPSEGWATFYDMVTLRMKNMRVHWDQHRWDDFKIEKDKCVVVSMLANNSIPHSKVLGIWRDVDLLVDMLPGVLAKQTKFPIFLKSCHLTAGADNSVLKPPFKSVASFEERKEMIPGWLNQKWKKRSNDYERTWSADANPLMGTLKPGFMLQTPASFTLELKIEVIWGRVYLLMVDGMEAAITRDRELQYYERGTFTSDWLNQNVEPPQELAWILEEEHDLVCIEIAEKLAKIVGIDEIRVDIFIKKGQPKNAMVNEDSISSGGQYRSHFNHMAEVWAMGHRDKLYKLKPVTAPSYAAATNVAYNIPRYGGSHNYATAYPTSDSYE